MTSKRWEYRVISDGKPSLRQLPGRLWTNTELFSDDNFLNNKRVQGKRHQPMWHQAAVASSVYESRFFQRMLSKQRRHFVHKTSE
ncbi:hypothetical protein HNY73_018000 [Argiope bruennichi]|uniref:Uncharacterized protein n=1 Tax=Argiope bruennichi TaxID=94029 RepID=A0A8T0EES0_ARGBR|nr:hypothetical protein HNY73_018000 [Argiope bruennichi]